MNVDERLAALGEQGIAFGPAMPLQRHRRTGMMSGYGYDIESGLPSDGRSQRSPERQAFVQNWVEKRMAQIRVRQNQRKLMVASQQRAREKHAAIFARARGEAAPSPTPHSALEMTRMLTGQALFDPAAAKILANLGLNPDGRNRSWKGPVYSEASTRTQPQRALDTGIREKTATPRVRQ
jgi:hypothetical protein